MGLIVSSHQARQLAVYPSDEPHWRGARGRCGFHKPHDSELSGLVAFLLRPRMATRARARHGG